MAEVSVEISGEARTGSNADVPEAGQLVRVRGQQWVVSNVNNSRQPADEKQRELGAIKRRYENVRELVFPFSIALCAPDGGNE
jgi:hypothetical protein